MGPTPISLHFNIPELIFTLESMSQISVPQHPRVEVEGVPLVRAEEGLCGDLEVTQRQPGVV